MAAHPHRSEPRQEHQERQVCIPLPALAVGGVDGHQAQHREPKRKAGTASLRFMRALHERKQGQRTDRRKQQQDRYEQKKAGSASRAQAQDDEKNGDYVTAGLTAAVILYAAVGR